MKDLTFWNRQIKVHRLHHVRDFKRGDGEFTGRLRRQFDWNVDRAGTGVRNGVVEFVKESVSRLLAGDGHRANQRTGRGRTLPSGGAVNVQTGLIRGVGMERDGEVGDGGGDARRRC